MQTMRYQTTMTLPLSNKLAINGILLVNKPRDLTSNAVLQRVKRLYGAKKAGHTGSLDPLATGMLPICFGEATKCSQYWLDADKCYTATGLLGVKTNTADAMGTAIARVDEFVVSEEALRSVLTQFMGPIVQTPSMFSALKHQGQPLYRFARQGIDIERKTRSVFIHALQLNAFDGRLFELTVRCSKGTYIRNLVEDIGERLGVYAHVTQLHREYTAGFEQEPMHSLDALTNMTVDARLAALLSMERAMQDWPRVILSNAEVLALYQGKTVHVSGEWDWIASVCLYNQTHQWIGFGEWNEAGLLKAKRLASLIN